MYQKNFKKKLVTELIRSFSHLDDYDTSLKKCLIKLNEDSKKIERVKSFFSLYSYNDVTFYFSNLIFEELKIECKNKIKKKGTTDKVFYLVIKRLEIISKYKAFDSNWVLSNLTLKNSIFLKKLLFKICDEIWILAGDESLDYNYYSKRFLLMKVYLSTFNFWIRDISENMEETKNFLKNQLDNVSKIGKYKFELKEFIRKFIP